MFVELVTKEIEKDCGIAIRREVAGEWVEENEVDIAVYRFHENERRDLAECLTKFDQQNVNSFLDDLAKICWQRKHRDPPGTAEQRRQYAGPMLANFQQALVYLDRLSQGEVYEDIRLTPKTKLADDTHSVIENLAPFISEVAEDIKPSLNQLVEALTLHLEPGKRGRSTIDDKEFCFQVAQKYHEHLRVMPSGYLFGPFVSVYKICARLAGLKDLEDPSKTVGPTIKRLKEQIKIN